VRTSGGRPQETLSTGEVQRQNGGVREGKAISRTRVLIEKKGRSRINGKGRECEKRDRPGQVETSLKKEYWRKGSGRGGEAVRFIPPKDIVRGRQAWGENGEGQKNPRMKGGGGESRLQVGRRALGGSKSNAPISLNTEDKKGGRGFFAIVVSNKSRTINTITGGQKCRTITTADSGGKAKEKDMKRVRDDHG